METGGQTSLDEREAHEKYEQAVQSVLNDWYWGKLTIQGCEKEEHKGGMMDSLNELFGMDSAYAATAAGALVTATAVLY